MRALGNVVVKIIKQPHWRGFHISCHEKRLYTFAVWTNLKVSLDMYKVHKRIPLPPRLFIHKNLFPELTPARYKIGCHCFILLAVRCLRMLKRMHWSFHHVHWSGTVRKYEVIAFRNLFLYCLGEIMVGEAFLGPPSMPDALTHVSKCLSQVYCLMKSIIPITSSLRSSSTPTSKE